MLGYPFPFREGENYEIDSSTGCWNWLGKSFSGRDKRPIIRKDSRLHNLYGTRYVHQIAYIATYGEPNHCVCHTCNNVNCINPNHLYDGSHQDNMDDKEKVNMSNTKLMLYGRLNPGWTYKEAGKFFGVDHTTVWYRVKKYPKIDFGRTSKTS